MLNGKVTIINLININVKVDLSNYATKLDLKNATGVDTSKLAAK